MATFPGALPTFAGFTASHTLAADNHASQHNSEQAEIIAVATKIGTGASTPTSGKLLRGNGSGTSVWAQADLTSDVTGILPQANGGTGTTSATGTGAAVYQTSPTITTPSITNPSISGGGTWSGGPTISGNPTLGGSPTISDFTNATHTHRANSSGGLLDGSALNLNTATNNIVYDGLGSTTYTLTGSYANVTGLTAPTVNSPIAGTVMVVGTVDIVQASGTSADLFFRVLKDGATAPNYPTAGEIQITVSSATANNRHQCSVMFIFTGVTAGNHTWTAQATGTAGTMRIDNTHTNLLVIPLDS